MNRLRTLIPLPLRRSVLVVLPWRLAYLHVPKVANTSVKAALATGLRLPPSPHLPVTRDRYWREVDPKVARIIPLASLLFDPRYSDFWSFAIVRDPVDRLVSCYLNKIVRNQALTPSFEAQGFRRGMSFPDFVRRVCELPDRRADAHVVSQARFVAFRGSSAASLTFPMSDLRAGWSEVQRQLREHRGVELPSLPHRNSNRTVQAEVTVSPELRSRIEQRYARDFELLARAKDWRRR